MELGQAEDGFLLQLVQFWVKVVAAGQRLLPLPTMFWYGLDHVKAGSSLVPPGILDPKFNSISGRAWNCPSVLGRSMGKAGCRLVSCQLPRLGDWWLGTQNCGAQLKVRVPCPLPCCVSPSPFRENHVTAGHHNVQQKAEESPAKACHTGGPATTGPLREEPMALLEGFLVFLRKSNRWKSQQQLDSVRDRLLLHGARRWDQEGDSVMKECHSSPGPFQDTSVSWLPPPFQLPGAWISRPAK